MATVHHCEAVMIRKLLSNAMLSLVMDKQAKAKLQAIQQGRKITEDEGGMRSPLPAAEQIEGRQSPDRRELIAQAMAIHQTQSKIFDDLTLNEKRQLQELAAKALLGESGNDTEAVFAGNVGGGDLGVVAHQHVVETLVR